MLLNERAWQLVCTVVTLLAHITSSTGYIDRDLFDENADYLHCKNNGGTVISQVFCLPNNYRKDVPPSTEFGPLGVYFKLQVSEISEIDDHKSIVTLRLGYKLRWPESRMFLNHSNDWSQGEINISPDNIQALWIPDVIIHDLVSFTKPEILTAVAALEIFSDKRVYYKIRSDITIVCRAMQFGRFPLDSHKCYFMLTSFGYDDSKMLLDGRFSYDKENQRTLSFNVDIQKLPDHKTLFMGSSSNYSVYGFEINLSRSLGPFILSVYLPSAMFVMMSWVSFFIPPDVVPARIVLLVTLCLVLINMFNSTTTRIPVSNTVTALEVWLLACMLLVFLSLLEYAIILRQIVIYRRKREKDCRRTYSNGNNGNTPASSYTTINYNNTPSKGSTEQYFPMIEADTCLGHEPFVDCLVGDEAERKKTARRRWRRTNSLHRKVKKSLPKRSEEERLNRFKNTLDRGAFFLFPFVFLVFNSVYWTLYLTVILTEQKKH